jgi:hypothetical protein
MGIVICKKIEVPMTPEELIRLVISFLGGGTVAGILNWVFSAKSASKARKTESLTQQLNLLYGPLFFFVSQNDDMFKLNSKFQTAYKTEYTGDKWSQDEDTQKNLRAATSCTLDIANKYIGVVKNNNEKIVEVLVNNYSFIDPDDVEVFQQFMIDYTRMKTEVDKDGTLQTPFEIYLHIGDISFMKSEFMEKVKSKFYLKKQQLNELN